MSNPLLRITLHELLDRDSVGPFDDYDFDDAVFCALLDMISTPKDAVQFPLPVGLYFASVMLQNDVGHGGFAEAAFNMPEWFELAAAGYRALGKNKTADVISEVRELLPGNEQAVKELRADETKWEDYFSDHVFQIYDRLVFDSDD